MGWFCFSVFARMRRGRQTSGIALRLWTIGGVALRKRERGGGLHVAENDFTWQGFDVLNEKHARVRQREVSRAVGGGGSRGTGAQSVCLSREPGS